MVKSYIVLSIPLSAYGVIHVSFVWPHCMLNGEMWNVRFTQRCSSWKEDVDDDGHELHSFAFRTPPARLHF